MITVSQRMLLLLLVCVLFLVCKATATGGTAGSSHPDANILEFRDQVWFDESSSELRHKTHTDGDSAASKGCSLGFTVRVKQKNSDHHSNPDECLIRQQGRNHDYRALKNPLSPQSLMHSSMKNNEAKQRKEHRQNVPLAEVSSRTDDKLDTHRTLQPRQQHSDPADTDTVPQRHYQPSSQH